MIVHEIQVAIAFEVNKQHAQMISDIVKEGQLSILISLLKSFFRMD